MLRLRLRRNRMSGGKSAASQPAATYKSKVHMVNCQLDQRNGQNGLLHINALHEALHMLRIISFVERQPECTVRAAYGCMRVHSWWQVGACMQSKCNTEKLYAYVCVCLRVRIAHLAMSHALTVPISLCQLLNRMMMLCMQAVLHQHSRCGVWIVPPTSSTHHAR